MLLLLAAGLGFMLFVYVLAVQGDDRREADQRRALREAVEERGPCSANFRASNIRRCG